MPGIVTSSENRPSYVDEPNMRFAFSPLGIEYRDYSINGEVLIDKATGELFFKRDTDGKIISFNQNKKYLYDLTLEFMILINNNKSFVYPNTSGNFFVYQQFDLVSINNEVLYNALTSDIEISNDTDLHSLKFRVSSGTNGFFLRLVPRDSDKSICEYVTSAYNKCVKEYTGTDANILTEQAKFESISKWEHSNAVITFEVTITKNSTTKTYTSTDYVRINESGCIYIPIANIENNFRNGYDYADITINKIEYPKFHFMENHSDLFDDYDIGIDKLIEARDSMIQINYAQVIYFIENAKTLEITSNSCIISIMESPYLLEYLDEVSTIAKSPETIVSTERPSSDTWSVNSTWLERIRDITEDGQIIIRNAETDFNSLETYLADKLTSVISNGVITDDESQLEDFIAEEV